MISTERVEKPAKPRAECPTGWTSEFRDLKMFNSNSIANINAFEIAINPITKLHHPANPQSIANSNPIQPQSE
jgi:hypothetical protein